MKKARQSAWVSVLNGDPVPWLLDENNPCVRYRTMTELLDRPADDTEVRSTAEAAWQYPPAAALLKALAEVEPFPPGTTWRAKQFKKQRGDLDILYRVGVPGGHPTIQEACERWLAVEMKPGADCYANQMVAGLTRFADPEDARLREKVRFVTTNEILADGNRPGVLRYGARGTCCGSHSCHMAVAKAMWAVVGLAPDKRTPETETFIRRGAGYLAAHRLYQSSRRPGHPIAKQFLDLHLPFAQGCDTDFLDLLDIATQAGLECDQSIADALNLLLSKQNGKGRWTVETGTRWGPDKGRLAGHVATLEAVGKESKWITLGALLILKRCERFLAGARRTDLGSEAIRDAECLMSHYPFEYEPTDEQRTRDAWGTFNASKILDALVAFADKRGLATGWHWGFVMGPHSCPEWCAARPRWIPRKGMREAWPVGRVFFLCRRGQFTKEAVAEKLGVPVVDENEKARFNKMFWRALWRVRIAKWRDDYDEVAVTVRDRKELTRLFGVMDAALTEFPQCHSGQTP